MIVLLIIGLLSEGGGSVEHTTARPRAQAHSKHAGGAPGHAAGTRAHAASTLGIVALSLRPSAAVYVCLIDDDGGRKLIPGLELQPGRARRRSTPRLHDHPRHSSVTMFVDGSQGPAAPERSDRVLDHARPAASG